MDDKSGYVYIMASRINGTIYVGVTSDLAQRVHLHRKGIGSAFTARYGVKRLVYYEDHANIEAAIAREKTVKKWRRKWKLELIEGFNPYWRDLYSELFV